MYSPTEQITDFNKANVAQATRLATLAMENAEKLVNLNLNAAKIVLAKGAESAAAAASVKDVQDLMALRAKYAESGVEAATAYTRSLYEISSQAQAQFTALAEEAWSAYTKDTAAFDQFQKATKQVVSLADASVRAASANAANAMKATGKGRKAA